MAVCSVLALPHHRSTAAPSPSHPLPHPSRCATPGPVAPGGSAGPQGSTYPGDWKTIEKLTSFVGSATPPFFGFVGTNILHPPYQTNDYWYSRANTTALPQWAPLTSLHPCDLQVGVSEELIVGSRAYFCLLVVYPSLLPSPRRRHPSAAAPRVRTT